MGGVGTTGGREINLELAISFLLPAAFMLLLLAFLWRRKLYWMIPVVSILLFFGLIIVVGSSKGMGPFIYTLF